MSYNYLQSIAKFKYFYKYILNSQLKSFYMKHIDSNIERFKYI